MRSWRTDSIPTSFTPRELSNFPLSKYTSNSPYKVTTDSASTTLSKSAIQILITDGIKRYLLRQYLFPLCLLKGSHSFFLVSLSLSYLQYKWSFPLLDIWNVLLFSWNMSPLFCVWWNLHQHQISALIHPPPGRTGIEFPLFLPFTLPVSPSRTSFLVISTSYIMIPLVTCCSPPFPFLQGSLLLFPGSFIPPHHQGLFASAAG